MPTLYQLLQVLVLRFRSPCHIGNFPGPHPEEHRASDASRRMAADDGRASDHPSRRKPLPCGQRLAPQDEDRKPGNDRFHGIARLGRGGSSNRKIRRERQGKRASLELICPSGYFLSSPVRKNIPLPRGPKSPLYPRPSRPTRGAYRDRHGRGMGCGGRGSVRRAMGSQGGLLSVSDVRHARRRRCISFRLR